MKCNQCKGKLTEYIEGHLSTEEDEEIRNHLLTCDSCKTQYDIEVLEHKAFKETFSYENVNFENSTDKIMNKIDRNRYVKGRVKMKRKFRGKLVVAAAFLLGVIVTAAVMGTMGNRGLLSSLVSSKGESDKAAESSVSNDTTKNSKNQINEEEKAETATKDGSEKVTSSGLTNGTSVEMYSKAEVATSKELTFNTPFIATENAQYEVSIEGKGETASEEGTGKLYIKDTVGNKMYEYSVIDTKTQESPLSISWYDNNYLMIVHGGAYGTLVNGTKIIILDVTTGEQFLIASAGDRERYKSIERSGENLVLKYVLYVDDALNEFEDKEKVISNYVLGEMIK